MNDPFASGTEITYSRRNTPCAGLLVHFSRSRAGEQPRRDQLNWLLDRPGGARYPIVVTLLALFSPTGVVPMNPLDAPNLDRRHFLKATGAAALGLSQLPNPLSAAPARQQPDPFGGFTVGIQSYSFRNFKLEQALERTRDLGLRYVEFY